MKRKVVVKVFSMNGHRSGCCMNRHNSRAKAFKVVVGVSGVESFNLTGETKDQIEVTGEDIDAVEITKLLKKKLGFAKLLTVGPVEEPVAPEAEAPVGEPIVQPLVWPRSVPYGTIVPHFVPQVRYIDDPAPCSIM